MDGKLALTNIDPERIDIHIVDASLGVKEERHLHCGRCGKWLFSMNAKFAITHHGGSLAAGIYNEVPLNIFRMVRLCGQCRTYHIIYVDGISTGLQ